MATPEDNENVTMRKMTPKGVKLNLKNFILRTTVPLGSYTRKSLRFFYYVSLSTCCQNLEQNQGHWKNLGEIEVLSFKGSDQEKCPF